MGFFDVLFTYCILTGQTVLIHHFAKVHQERFVMPRAGLTNVGALFGKMCGGPLPPYTVESRIESKNARPIIFWGFYVFNFIIKYIIIDKDLDNKLDF